MKPDYNVKSKPDTRQEVKPTVEEKFLKDVQAKQKGFLGIPAWGWVAIMIGVALVVVTVGMVIAGR